jgi:hypothetical protein
MKYFSGYGSTAFEKSLNLALYLNHCDEYSKSMAIFRTQDAYNASASIVASRNSRNYIRLRRAKNLSREEKNIFALLSSNNDTYLVILRII